jgi:hypothetical protein
VTEMERLWHAWRLRVSRDEARDAHAAWAAGWRASATVQIVNSGLVPAIHELTVTTNELTAVVERLYDQHVPPNESTSMPRWAT